MPGLLYQACTRQGLLSSLAFPEESSHFVSNRICRLPWRHDHHAHGENLASGKHYSIQQWLRTQTWVEEGDNNNAGEDDGEDKDEGEEDLADMVHDFIENGSKTWQNNNGFLNGAGSNDHQSSPFSSYCESLQAIMEAMVPEEKEITSHLIKLVLNASDLDLLCRGLEDRCSGRCLDHLAIKHLQMLGYQASVCRPRWQSDRKLPGGEYEYISVSLKEKREEEQEEKAITTVVVDLDFRAQFEIARPAAHYSKALRLLPIIFAGGEGRLDGVLRVMSDAARCSLHQSCMPLPPWRTLDYLRAKWRRPNPTPTPTTIPNPEPAPRPCSNRHGHCIAQLHRLKQAVVQSRNMQTSINIVDGYNKPGSH